MKSALASAVLLTLLFSSAHSKEKENESKTKLWELGPDVDHVVFPIDLEFPEGPTSSRQHREVQEEEKQTESPRYAKKPDEPEATSKEIETDQQKLREMLAKHDNIMIMFREEDLELRRMQRRIGEAKMNEILFDTKMDYFHETPARYLEHDFGTALSLFHGFSPEQAERAIEVSKARTGKHSTHYLEVLTNLRTYRNVADHLLELAKTPLDRDRLHARYVHGAMEKLSRIGDQRVLPYIRKEWETTTQLSLDEDRRNLATMGARLGEPYFLQFVLDNFDRNGNTTDAIVLAKHRTPIANERFFQYIENQITISAGKEIDNPNRFYPGNSFGTSIALRYLDAPEDRELTDELAKLLLAHIEIPPKSGRQWGFTSGQIEDVIRLMSENNTTYADRLLEAMAQPGFLGIESSPSLDREMRVAYEKMGPRAARAVILNWLARKRSETGLSLYDGTFNYITRLASEKRKLKQTRTCTPIQNEDILDLYSTNNLELVLGRPAILGFEGHAVVEDDYLGEIVFSDVDIENQRVQGKHIVLESDGGDFVHLQHFLSDGSIAELQAAVVLTRKTAARLVNELDYAETQGFDLMQPSIEVQSFQFDLNRDPTSRALSGVIGLRTSLGDIGVRMHEVNPVEGESEDNCSNESNVSEKQIETDQNIEKLVDPGEVIQTGRSGQ